MCVCCRCLTHTQQQSTYGHDGLDIFLYASGTRSDEFRTSLRNDVLGQRLAHVLGVEADQRAVTASLAQMNTVGHPDGWNGTNALSLHTRVSHDPLQV